MITTFTTFAKQWFQTEIPKENTVTERIFSFAGGNVPKSPYSEGKTTEIVIFVQQLPVAKFG